MLDTTAKDAAIVRWTLLDLVQRDYADLPNGCAAYVVSEGETYRLEASNSFTAFSPLIIGRTVAGGNWFKRSKAYVVANFTLWVAGFNSKNYMLGYTPGQLLASGTVQADIVIGSTDNANSSFNGIVDGLGNLWWNIAGAAAGQAVSKIALRDTLQSGTPTPAVKLDISTAINAIAFDKGNNLWMEAGTATFVKYPPTAYANTGIPTARVTVAASGIANPLNFLLIDDQNNLWSTDFGDSKVVMLAASQLLTGATVAPSVVWSGSNFSGCSGLAIGPDGRMWISSYVAGAGTIRAFSLVNPATGNPAPAITLTGTGTTFHGTEDITFDYSGNLWVLNTDNGHLVRVPAAQLGASGAVTADADILIQTPTGSIANGSENINFAFNPNRSGLLPSGGPPIP